MLATMRPAQLHHPSSNSVGHSRSASRNSNYSASNSPAIGAGGGPSTSAKVSRSNSTRSNSDIGEKSAGMQANNNTTTKKNARSSKKAQAPSSLSKEVETVKPKQQQQQTTPGLITLSRPLHDERGNGSAAGGATNEGGDSGTEKTTKQRKRKDKTAGHLVPAPDAAVLSSSAPVSRSNGGGEGQWSMPAAHHRKEEEGPLTWQQQMLGASSTTTPEKKKTANGTKKGANKKGTSATSNAAPSPSSAKDSLTWQQELLGSNKARGPTFDVFADAKDEATFGSGNERQHGDGQSKGRKKQPQANAKSAGGGRKRADSAGEMRLGMAAGRGGNTHAPPSAPLSNLHHGGSFATAMEYQGPSTPNGKLAYAGPNFHNSPSAASLPVPKFLQQKNAINSGEGEIPKSPSSPFAREAILRNAVKGTGGSGVSSNDGDASTSSEEGADEEDALRRSGRGATAPPELQRHDRSDGVAEDKRSMTIEGLLAKMMRPGSD